MSVIAVASALATQGSVTLLFQPKVGSTIKYANTMVQSNPMQGGNQTISSTSTMKVQSFNGGFYTISISSSDMKVSGSKGQNQKPMPPITLVIDKYGTPKKSGSGDAGGMQQLMNSVASQGNVMMFPKKAVKVGETWSNTVDLGSVMKEAMKGQKNAQMKGMKMTGKITTNFKLVKISGNSVVISSSMNGNMNMDMSGAGAGGGQGMKIASTIGGTGQYTIDKPTGTTSNMTMKMNIGVMGQNITQSMTMKKI